MFYILHRLKNTTPNSKMSAEAETVPTTETVEELKEQQKEGKH